MRVIKKKIGELEKCYSLSMLNYHGQQHLLAAAEKKAGCLLFDLDGNPKEVIWEGPGGTMSMVPVPNREGQFLATQQFYSPNDSKEAKIVVVTAREEGGWEVRTLIDLPFVHRFDILRSGENYYLIACTLKSGHQYQDDWSSPGKVYAGLLPDDLSQFSQDHQFKIEVIKDNMMKNHGYFRYSAGSGDSAVISCEQGIYQFMPPSAKEEEWEISCLIDRPASDALLLDLDSCGEAELFVLSPFHGDTIDIYKRDQGVYKKVYTYPEPLEFLHAICGADIGGYPTVVVGHRKGRRALMTFRFDRQRGYYAEVIDEDTGSANVLHYTHNGCDVLVAANREIDEIASYTFEKE